MQNACENSVNFFLFRADGKPCGHEHAHGPTGGHGGGHDDEHEDGQNVKGSGLRSRAVAKKGENESDDDTSDSESEPENQNDGVISSRHPIVCNDP